MSKYIKYPKYGRFVVNADGIPLGVIFRDTSRPTFDQRVKDTTGSKEMKSVESLIEGFAI